METAAWWPGALLAVVSGLVVLLFVVTLLLHHVPVLEKWLLPVLVRIAPAKVQQHQQQQQQAVLRQPQKLSEQIQQQRQRSSQFWNNDHSVHHQLALAQHTYQRSRTSRPCSLPCLPEEKMAYYSSGGSSPVASSVVAVAAAAAAQAAQAAAMPHRPHSFYPPLDDDDSGGEDDEDDEKLYTEDDEEEASIATVASAPAAPTQTLSAAQQRGRIHHKLNLALHSDGSEASNSSSSASAINEQPDAPLARRHYHRPAHPVVRRHHRSSGGSGGGMATQGAPGEASSSSSAAVLRQRAAHRDSQQQQLFDRDPNGVTHDASARRPNNECWSRPTVHRQSSLLAETDCDDSMMDMTDMSSTFGESDSIAGGTLRRRPGAPLIGARSASVDAINKVLIELGITYSASTCKVAVRVIELRQLSQVGRNTSVQLRLLLLPDRKQRHKSKMRFVSDGSSVAIAETFIFGKIEPAELCHTGVRFRLYGSERLRRERLLGEASVGLVAIGLETQREQPLIVTLDFKSATYKKSLGSLGRSTSSSSSRGDGSPTSTGEDNWPPDMIPPRQGIPELLLGLAYNGTTGRLSVEVLRASALRSWTSTRTPDVCVKLLLLTQTGQELGRAKTSLKKNSDGPTWLETFSFQVTLFQMADVTLLVSVVNKKSLKRRELLGWVSLGYDSPVEQQSEHWQEMREAAGEQVCHWHALMPP